MTVEGVGHDRMWGSTPAKCPVACAKIVGGGCNQHVCIAGRFKGEGEEEPEAHDFKDTCSAMQMLSDLKSVVTLHLALGKCPDLFSQESKCEFLFYQRHRSHRRREAS